VIAARDPMGIRPLFYGFIDDKICFSSEAKSLIEFCEEIKPFPPGHYYIEGRFVPFHNYEKKKAKMDLEEACKGIHDHLVEAVKKTSAIRRSRWFPLKWWIRFFFGLLNCGQIHRYSYCDFLCRNR
jgi:asparagine synthetase B (glutamine-hydrolysing)